MTTSEDIRQTYISFYVLKMLDLDPKEGGVELPVILPSDWSPLEPVIDRLIIDGLVEINQKKGRYQITQRGIDYVGTLIDEAEAYIDEFDDEDVLVMIRELERRHIDPMRVRFLWGWYQGEFDDPVVFQQRRGVVPVEHDWASYLLSDDFFSELARDYAGEAN